MARVGAAGVQGQGQERRRMATARTRTTSSRTGLFDCGLFFSHSRLRRSCGFHGDFCGSDTVLLRATNRSSDNILPLPAWFKVHAWRPVQWTQTVDAA